MARSSIRKTRWLVVAVYLLLLASCDSHRMEEEGFLAEPGSILFFSDESGTAQLYSMEPDGSDVRRLTDDPDFHVGRAVWSPDGTKIVFEGPQELAHYGPALYVVNADGTGRYRLTHVTTPGVHPANGEYPVWSPDGRRIAFRRVMFPEAAGILDVYVVDIDGTNEQRVTATPNLLEYIGSWTPQGHLLVSVFDYNYRDSLGRLAENSKLVALGLDGTYEWTRGEDGEILAAPILSPDGSQIAFNVRFKARGIRPVQEEIHVMSVDGTGRRQLTNSEHQYVVPIDWSPDGTLLLVQAGTPPGQGLEWILIVPLDGSESLDITPCPQGKSQFCLPTSWRR